MGSDSFYIIQTECNRKRLEALEAKLNFESFKDVVISELTKLGYWWPSNVLTASYIRQYYDRFIQS